MRTADAQVRKLMEEMSKRGQVGQAARRSGMDRRTARRYLAIGRLPSEESPPRSWRTRPDPFEEAFRLLPHDLHVEHLFAVGPLAEGLDLVEPLVNSQGHELGASDLGGERGWPQRSSSAARWTAAANSSSWPSSFTRISKTRSWSTPR